MNQQNGKGSQTKNIGILLGKIIIKAMLNGKGIKYLIVKEILSNNLREFFNYRHVLYNLVSTELKIRYRRSILGFFWSLLHPLLTMIAAIPEVAQQHKILLSIA